MCPWRWEVSSDKPTKHHNLLEQAEWFIGHMSSVGQRFPLNIYHKNYIFPAVLGIRPAINHLPDILR